MWASVNVCVRLVRAHIVFILKLNWIRDIWKKHFFPYSSFGYIVLEKSKATLKNPQVMISSIWSSVNSFHCMYIYLLASHTYKRLFKSLSKYIRREKRVKERKMAREWMSGCARERAPATFTIHIHTQIIEDDEIQSGNHKSASTIFFTQPPLNWLKFFNFLFLFFSRLIHICNKLLWFLSEKMNIFCGIFLWAIEMFGANKQCDDYDEFTGEA